ncbi:S4 domain-containing protein YaaA [Streptococcus uberis]|uniref:S4 domain-containing protein YaaA n=1 Tax=Streptococcus uberis TaxID=1349 RepID=UPI00193977F3|nr:S4 domain-containing protein YaaA [Streptococcus uberis]
MEYKLFTEFITLQALLKELGIIQSGGAIKSFLNGTTVLVNGTDEKRRGKKLRIGDVIRIPSQNIEIIIVEPSDDEMKKRIEDQKEKERVSKLVKELNQNKKSKVNQTINTTTKTKLDAKNRKPVRFPGT